MMSEYLQGTEFSHILFLDADAAFFNLDHDTLQGMEAELERSGTDIFVADEDWLDANGKGRVNGGMQFVKSSAFSINLYLDMFASHVKGNAGPITWPRIGVSGVSCLSNEQLCLDALIRGSGDVREKVGRHIKLGSGQTYNRGSEAYIGDDDETLQILHFMGARKNYAPINLCTKGRIKKWPELKDYACKQDVTSY